METSRPWYKKKRYIGSAVIGVLAIIGIAGASTPTPATPIPSVEAVQQTQQPVAPQQQVQQAPAQQTASAPDLSNDNYYTNVSGNEVHSPAYSENDTVPEGATAECNDDTYSFSQHRSGTCSHHGGVEEWLN